MKKLALFDIDGVIYDGHSIFDLIQEQEKSNYIKKGLWNKILEILEKYKNGELIYKKAADAMLFVHSQNLIGKKYQDLVNENLNFIKQYKNKLGVNFFSLFLYSSIFSSLNSFFYIISTN